MITALALAAFMASPPIYGPTISLADAKRVLVAAQADAATRKAPTSIVIVDRFGELVLAEVAAGADGAAFDLARAEARFTVSHRGTMNSGNGANARGALLMSNGMIVGAIAATGGANDKVAHAGAAVSIAVAPTVASAPKSGAGMAPSPTPAAPGAPGAPGAPAAMTAAPIAAYGPPITSEQTRIVADTALAEKVRRGTDQLALAVVDPAGQVVFFERQDNATFGNGDMAILKARAAARLRRPTSMDTARLKAGDNILLLVPGAFPADGGQPIVKNGALIGAVGLAGGGGDAEVAVLAAKAVE